MYDGPGRYRHYKGGEYEVLGLAVAEGSVNKRDSLDGADVEVVYRPLTPGSLLEGSPAEFWTRPLVVFDMEVTIRSSGKKVPRFEKVSS